jgi:hypothetical protein
MGQKGKKDHAKSPTLYMTKKKKRKKTRGRGRGKKKNGKRTPGLGKAREKINRFGEIFELDAKETRHSIGGFGGCPSCEPDSTFGVVVHFGGDGDGGGIDGRRAALRFRCVLKTRDRR